MLMNKPEKQIKSNSDKKKTPTPVISGYTKEEMEEIYSFAQSKIGEKPSEELADQPRMDFKIGDRAVQHTDKGKRVKIDPSRASLLTDFGRETLEDRYLMPGESFQDLFARVASFYGDDQDHAQRLYDYISKLWFMPSTPVLSNGGTGRGLPISCFLNEANDSLGGIVDLWTENVWLASKGGGIGSYWGNLRSIGEPIGGVGKTSGIVPFIRVMDSLTLAISQGSLRRGSAAVYLPIDHPEIEEFIEIRRPTGGDPNRKALNLHHGIQITDAFMRAVEENTDWDLRSPHDQSVQKTVSARSLWIRMLTARIETGEPYLVYKDTVNNLRPEHQKLAGLEIKTSNLCSEITLPTGLDHHGENRTAVCCLSSVNLEKFFEWENEKNFIPDIMRFLDNVLQDFIDNAPDTMKSAAYAAMRERSVGLGVMGLHSFFQANNVPWESAVAKSWNKKMFNHIKTQADQASIDLAKEKGACPDAEEYGIMERFSNKTAVAPTASISIICGGSSPGIEPIAANVFAHKTLSGTFTVRNRHLKMMLEEKKQDNDEVWLSILSNRGSVQHLDFLSDHEKDVYKTAFEIDQRWLIDLAGDRSEMIDQAQSLNVFLPADSDKSYLHEVHYAAWKKGVKSLYYCRSLSLQRAENSSNKPDLVEVKTLDDIAAEANPNDYDECLACQ